MSQTQNVQRGIIFMFFVQIVILMVAVMVRFCKNKLDTVDDTEEQGQGEAYKEKKQSKVDRESQDRIESNPDFDKIAVQQPKPDEEATCVQKWFYQASQFSSNYAPILLLLPLNIITGTSKAFCFILLFALFLTIGFLNLGKLHRQLCGESKCTNVIFDNLWLLLCLFIFINHWGAFTIAMPYIVV